MGQRKPEPPEGRGRFDGDEPLGSRRSEARRQRRIEDFVRPRLDPGERVVMILTLSYDSLPLGEHERPFRGAGDARPSW